MPTITLSAVAPLVKDYCRNQNLTDARIIRALDQAADIVNSELVYELIVPTKIYNEFIGIVQTEVRRERFSKYRKQSNIDSYEINNSLFS
jgi:hypothetical protein